MHKERVNSLTEAIIGAAAYELLARGFSIERQQAFVVEVKSVDKLERVHSAQLLSYLKFAPCRVGLLFNFNVSTLSTDGLKRVVNGVPE
jgi:PD-(D/E)XK nuclease superfamily